MHKETLNDRGFDTGAYLHAVASGDEDAITLTHPANWLTEDEMEDGHTLQGIMLQLATVKSMIRFNGGF